MKTLLMLGGMGGFLSVALGAFAAHALKDRLEPYYLGVFRTGVEYQFYHSLALVLVALLVDRYASPMFRNAGWAFTIGILIFSGSLYLLTFTQVKAFGAITPIGGVSFLVGWIFLILGASKLS